MQPLISVCVPAYNRSHLLRTLLDSVLIQAEFLHELVICEDNSPERLSIREIVEEYQQKWPTVVKYFENASNVGYDANLRRLIDLATGDYCLFLGNDDLLNVGALEKISAVLHKHPRIGVVLRSYAIFDGQPENITQITRYFAEDRIFPSGPDTIVTFFRRMVVICGIVFRREFAAEHSTPKFDGTLLYQLYLTGRILQHHDGYFTSSIVALYRSGGTPDFGNSLAERGKFEPTQQTPGSSLQFMEGMLSIARTLEEETGLALYRPILKDLSNYSYPFIAVQSGKGIRTYSCYVRGLAKMGFGRYPLFYCYCMGLLVLGRPVMDSFIRHTKNLVGHTPLLGRVYVGQASWAE